ncbi:hypothetical protein [Pararhizobium sp. O133]
MTIISMITLSALVLVCMSHMAATRAQKQAQKQPILVPVRVRYPGRR